MSFLIFWCFVCAVVSALMAVETGDFNYLLFSFAPLGLLSLIFLVLRRRSDDEDAWR